MRNKTKFIYTAFMSLIGLTEKELDLVLPGRKDKKYDPETLEALPFEGISLIHPISKPEAERLKLQQMAIEFKQVLANEGLDRVFAFVDLDSFHATIFDLINEPETRDAFSSPIMNPGKLQYQNIRKQIELASIRFLSDTERKGFPEPNFKATVGITGIDMFAPGVIKLNLKFKDPQKEDQLNKFRQELQSYLLYHVRPGYEMVRKKTNDLAGHLTLGYTMRSVPKNRIQPFLEILNRINGKFTGGGEFAAMEFEITLGVLTKFTDMNHYYPIVYNN